MLAGILAAARRPNSQANGDLMVLDGPFDGAQMQILRHVMLDVLRPLRLRPLPFNR